jgi:hypothetical protein
MLRYAIEKMPEAERKDWMVTDGRSLRSDVRCSKPTISPFAGIPVPDFVDIILHDTKQSDEAMY